MRSLLETSITLIGRKLPLRIPTESCLSKAILQSCYPVVRQSRQAQPWFWFHSSDTRASTEVVAVCPFRQQQRVRCRLQLYGPLMERLGAPYTIVLLLRYQVETCRPRRGPSAINASKALLALCLHSDRRYRTSCSRKIKTDAAIIITIGTHRLPDALRSYHIGYPFTGP